MALDRTFVALTPKRLAAMIMDARRRAVYAAPSVSSEVATALINIRDRSSLDVGEQFAAGHRPRR